MFAYMDFIIGFMQTHFNKHNYFHGYPKFDENIVQYFLPKRIIGFLGVHE
jgi:hypothetical protein